MQNIVKKIGASPWLTGEILVAWEILVAMAFLGLGAALFAAGFALPIALGCVAMVLVMIRIATITLGRQISREINGRVTRLSVNQRLAHLGLYANDCK